MHSWAIKKGCSWIDDTPFLCNDVSVFTLNCVLNLVCKERVLDNSQVITLDTGCVYSDKVGYRRLTAIELNYRCLYFVWIINIAIFAIRESRIKDTNHEKT